MKRKFFAMICALAIMAPLFVACRGGSSNQKSVSGDATYTMLFGHTLTEQDPFH